MKTSSTIDEYRHIARLLHDLGRAVRDGIVEARGSAKGLQSVEKVSASDTIYRIDRIGEDALLEWFDKNWPDDLPIDIIAEGLGDEKGERFPRNTAESRFTVLIDPIDGTRGLMHDKRSAWVLAGAADKPAAAGPDLRDLIAGAMVEIPVTRQPVSDSICGWLAGAERFEREAARESRPGARPEAMHFSPSRANDLFHGFASFVSYFSDGKEEIARIENEFLRLHLPADRPSSPLVFTDQYISSGGQIFELLAGRDRMVADLRPLVFGKLGMDTALTCHPYDLACLPAALASGCVLEDPWGQPISAPIDTVSPVAWVGYANENLADTLRPLLREALENNGYSSSTNR